MIMKGEASGHREIYKLIWAEFAARGKLMSDQNGSFVTNDLHSTRSIYRKVYSAGGADALRQFSRETV